MPAVRCARNPLIEPKDVKPTSPDWEVIGAFNGGVVRYGSEVLLLLRIAERPREVPSDYVAGPRWNPQKGQSEFVFVRKDTPGLDPSDPRSFWHEGRFYTTSISHLRLCRSTDGEAFDVPDTPTLFPSSPIDALGLEDARITPIDGDFLITVKVVGHHGIAVRLYRTRDFASFESLGLIFQPHNLDVVIFPERVGGLYYAWTRPVCPTVRGHQMWMASSPDLLHWGAVRPMLAPRPGQWDGGRVGASCVPICTNRGWLEIYHGATPGDVYGLGTVLTALDEPTHVLARCQKPILLPEDRCETEGFLGGVVFACGHVMEGEDTAAVYYGAADESTCLARFSVAELLDQLERKGG
jgi:predicted GH43/DUF377 family glycosyl hydrolase